MTTPATARVAPSRRARRAAASRLSAGGSLLPAVADLLTRVAASLDDPAPADDLGRAAAALDAPLSLCLAGKIKAGKSTLLNALLGERLAPTGAAECTQAVTWYRWGDQPSVAVHPLTGRPWSCAPLVGPRGLTPDLRGTPPGEIGHVEVTWPAAALREVSLVDTPGLDALSRAASRRAGEFLTEGRPVDVVVYLLRHLHATDLRTVAMLDDLVAGGLPVHVLGVVSRADEVGSGRIDAMVSAERVARRYRGDGRLGRDVHVVAAAGLLAETAQTLTAAEVQDLQTLSELDRPVVERLLLSVDRFRSASVDLPVSPASRTALLDRLGMFGVRTCMALLRRNPLPPEELAEQLLRRSGVGDLRDHLAAVEPHRRLARARTALVAAAQALDSRGDEAHRLGAETDRMLVAVEHASREAAVLLALRAGDLSLVGEARDEAWRLAGGAGHAARDRLGVRHGTGDLRSRAARAHERWSVRAEDPLLDRQTRRACLVLVRACEAVLDESGADDVLHAATGPRRG